MGSIGSATFVSAALDVDGMTCASCVRHVEKAVGAMAGVRGCQVNLARGKASIQFDPSRTTAQAVAKTITDAGYPAVAREPETAPATAEQRRSVRQMREADGWRRRAIVGIILWLPLEIIHGFSRLTTNPMSHVPAQAHWMGWAVLACSTIAIIYVGDRFFSSAWAALRHATSNMDTLISLGASVAYGYSLIFFVGGLAGAWRPPLMADLYFMEAAGLVALISLGHWLEARARISAGSAIGALLQLAPTLALRWDADSKTAAEIPLADLAMGDLVLVRPGDRVPIDGIVIDGQSSVDESMMTGEAIPVARAIGDKVIGGTINQDGRLILRVTALAGETALAQIVNLVEHAQSSKPPVQRLADRIAAVFVPSVLLIAVLTGIGWFFWGRHQGWAASQIASQMARTVCSVLVIACPCALGLAVPAAVMVGTGRGARRGILIRDVDALQNAEKTTVVVLDKTGTVTQGRPVVSELIALNGMSPDELLHLAASAEQFSAHPLAKAIVARARGMKLALPDSFSSEAGAGVTAGIAGQTVLVGSDALLRARGVPDAEPAHEAGGGTRVHVGRITMAGVAERLGFFIVSDPLKPDSARAIADLHRMGLRTVLLTGDSRAAADRVAKQVGIADVRADVKPAGKAAAIEQLRHQDNQIIAMVGDGINDAAALATADVGIAIGSGSDIAKEAGDMVLIGGSLAGVAHAIRLSRATMRTIRQNLFLAFIYNAIAIPFAAFGLVSPLFAAAAMALSDVTVIGNALLLSIRKFEGSVGD